MSYTPDLADFIYDYLHDTRLIKDAFHRINYAGITMKSINRLGYLYAKAAGDEHNYNLSLFSKNGLSIAAIVRHEAHRAKDIFYSFKKEILLDDSLLRKLFPNMSQKSLNQAVQETYNWYSKNA